MSLSASLHSYHNNLDVNHGASMSFIRCTQFRWLPKSRMSLSQGMQNSLGSDKPQLLLSKASIQPTVHMSSKKGKNQIEKRHRNNQHHFFKRTAQSGSGIKAERLVDIVMPLSNVKEEIYAALDEWVAFEIEFPIIALGMALKRLKGQEQWQRIIQVSKWMLSKGQGRTFATYDLLLKAYDMDARLEDCEALWEKILLSHTRSVPKGMFARMMYIYRRRQMPEKLLKVFEEMKKLKMKPDKDSLEMVKEVYRQLGLPEKQVELMEKYPPAWRYYTFKGKTIKVRARQPVEASIADKPGVETSEGNGPDIESVTVSTMTAMISSNIGGTVEL